MVKCTGRGLVVKRPGVLSKVQMLNLVLGVGVFSLLSKIRSRPGKPNQKGGGNEKFMNFTLLCIALGKQTQFTSNFG